MSSPGSIQVYNTLTRAKQAFAPLRAGHVGMYVCGPTVYDDCHIGHLMGPVLFDAVARWFAARGHVVRFVNNITDIDDKIINRSLATGEPWEAITTRYTAQYLGYLERLHVTTVTDHPRCSAYIAPMIRYIQDLVDGGRAYLAADGVYYDVLRQPGYGKLSGRRVEDMLAGARIERDADLHHPADFVLWKHAKPGEPSWPSPWGAGRPGWHIECSVMSNGTLGDTFDIHGGGDDLKFPHHENEIAQGEAHGGGYARCWMHNGLIQYEGVKVGKSDPRMKDPAFAGQFKADHLLDTYGAATIRFLLMQGHYRRPNDFAPGAIVAARTALGKFHRAINRAYPGRKSLMSEPLAALDLDEILHREILSEFPDIGASVNSFISAMDDDFNTGLAISHLSLLRRVAGMGQTHTPEGEPKLLPNDGLDAAILLRDLGRLIGLFHPGDEKDTSGSEGSLVLSGVMTLVLELRQHARAARDFAASDRIRDALTGAGITVKDAKDGAAWEGGADDALARVMALVLALRAEVRARKDFTASDRIRDGLTKAGIAVKDGKDGATWTAAG